MSKNLDYWINLYKESKGNMICLDIEVTHFGGPISVIGLYKPKEGLIECQNFVRGKNLSKENISPLFNDVKLILTFNGLAFDIPKIDSEFPGLIPDNIKIFDLHIFARAINYKFSLRTLENTFGIQRLTSDSEKKGVAIKLWQEYLKGNEGSLKKLLEYNAQDTINLYYLAEKLINITNSKSQ